MSSTQAAAPRKVTVAEPDILDRSWRLSVGRAAPGAVRTDLDLARFALARRLDGAAYGLGLWHGALRAVRRALRRSCGVAEMIYRTETGRRPPTDRMNCWFKQ